MYLHELMKTHDANEGINAFIEKRKPVWRIGEKEVRCRGQMSEVGGRKARWKSPI